MREESERKKIKDCVSWLDWLALVIQYASAVPLNPECKGDGVTCALARQEKDTIFSFHLCPILILVASSIFLLIFMWLSKAVSKFQSSGHRPAMLDFAFESHLCLVDVLNFYFDIVQDVYFDCAETISV